MANEKNPIVSGILSLIIPGLGQLYNGHAKKGAVVFVIAVVLYVLGMFITTYILSLIWALFAAYDAYMEAKGKPVWKFQ